MKPLLGKILREPLLHFIVGGVVIFFLSGIFGNSQESRAETIVVSSGQIEQLIATFTRTWQRPPLAEEIAGLIESYIREEIYYREALVMGLDRDDTVIRRRMQQKLEFITDDLLTVLDPTSEDLEEYLRDNPEAFKLSARLAFDQIFFNSDSRGESVAEQDALAVLSRLRSLGSNVSHTAWETWGDPLLLPTRFVDVTEMDMARIFGGAFSEAVLTLPVGEWVGAVKSGYGFHVLYIYNHVASRDPTLEEVRDAVEREWRVAYRDEAIDDFYQGMRERYTVTVEWPEAESGDEPLEQ